MVILLGRDKRYSLNGVSPSANAGALGWVIGGHVSSFPAVALTLICKARVVDRLA
jgi:hypothetical protein